jgi:hemerythrin-like domain-containing protein
MNSMKAFDDLSHEHELIRRMLSVLELLTRELQLDKLGAAADLREAIRFARGFADRCHHGKEERLLFPLIAGKNETVANMPVRILTSKHDAGRTLIKDLEDALPGIEAGDAGATAHAAQALTLYTRMLRKHIDKEENIVFPLARTLISQEVADKLAEQFEAVEQEMGPNAHATFGAILESLEARRQATPRLNAPWHTQHPMPRRPSSDQRVEWHLEHQKHCSCRQIPAQIEAEIQKRTDRALGSGAGRS